MQTTRIAHSDADYYIATQKPFVSSNVSGKWTSPNTYIVFSYTEPIAVFERDHKVATITEKKFSATTSKHQNMVKRALDNYKPQPYTVFKRADALS